jgi:hypothetical protein
LFEEVIVLFLDFGPPRNRATSGPEVLPFTRHVRNIIFSHAMCEKNVRKE